MELCARTGARAGDGQCTPRSALGPPKDYEPNVPYYVLTLAYLKVEGRELTLFPASSPGLLFESSAFAANAMPLAHQSQLLST